MWILLSSVVCGIRIWSNLWHGLVEILHEGNNFISFIDIFISKALHILLSITSDPLSLIKWDNSVILTKDNDDLLDNTPDKITSVGFLLVISVTI